MELYKLKLKTIFRIRLVRIALFTLILAMASITQLQTVHSSNYSDAKFLRVDFIPGQREQIASNGKFIMSFSKNIQAKVGGESAISLFYLDILGASSEVNPFVMNFPQGPAKLVRLNQTSVTPPVLRATFFLRHALIPVVNADGKTVEITFESKNQQTETNRNSYSLIAPEQKPAAVPQALKSQNLTTEKLAIKVADADITSIFRELARRMEKSVHFRDVFNKRITIDIQADTPLKAIQAVADKVGAVATIENGEIWISRKQNPMLLISDTDLVENADLSNLALGDVIRALGQIGELNISLDKSMDEIKTKSAGLYLHNTTVRRAFETLLKLHELTFKLVDDKTVVVMTIARARELEGKVLRVLQPEIPFDMLKTLIEQSISESLATRVMIQEDLGNLVITGDKEAVDVVETIYQSIENKLLAAGEGTIRQYFNPVNTKPEDLIAMLKDTIDESESIKINHDKRTDMMIVSGPASAVERSMQIIRKLDQQPTRQALVNIRLIEISRYDLDSLGIKIPEQLAAVSDIANINASPIVIPANFEGFIENSNVKTLANPTLRCMDKEESTIDISEQIPVKSTVTEYLPVDSASLAARTSDNWTTSEVGIKLSLTPTIHINDEISMKIDIDLTELIKLIEGHPWTAKRTISTMIRVKDMETVVIGGLIRNKNDNTRNPIPILSKIPLLRRLVRRLEYRDSRKEKSEMIVLITPTLVDSSGIKLRKKPKEQITANTVAINP